MKSVIAGLVLALTGVAGFAIRERADLAKDREGESRMLGAYRATGDRVREYLCDGVEGRECLLLMKQFDAKGLRAALEQRSFLLTQK
ncbi:MAG: hypothetical protein ABSB15_28020 [Bryobacteraceae bacterium]|jgi:hypothetical protein